MFFIGDFFYLKYYSYICIKKLKTMKTFVTISLIILTSIVYTIHNFFPETHSLFVLNPNDFELYQIVTSLFTHNSVLHFLFNIIIILVIGTKLEQKIGSNKLALGFFLIGILSNVLWTLYSNDPVSGMSGSIYGLLVMFVITHREYKTHLVFLPKFKFSIVYILLLTFLLELILMFFSDLKIAHSMHLTGMIIGAAYTFLVVNVSKPKEIIKQ